MHKRSPTQDVAAGTTTILGPLCLCKRTEPGRRSKSSGSLPFPTPPIIRPTVCGWRCTFPPQTLLIRTSWPAGWQAPSISKGVRRHRRERSVGLATHAERPAPARQNLRPVHAPVDLVGRARRRQVESTESEMVVSRVSDTVSARGLGRALATRTFAHRSHRSARIHLIRWGRVSAAFDETVCCTEV